MKLNHCGQSWTLHSSFWIPGDPVSWKAPNVTKGRRWSSHTPYLQHMRIHVRHQLMAQQKEPIQGAVLIKFVFSFSVDNKKTTPYHTRKPDLTNIIKLAEDALKGIVFHDDCQVIGILGEKHWGPGETKMEVWQIEDGHSCSTQAHPQQI